MSNKYTKIIAAFGVAAGLGVASLPAAGVFAAHDSNALDPAATNEVELTVSIAPKITISETGTHSVDMTSGQATDSTMNSVVTVTTNASKGYELTIKTKTAETGLVNEHGDKIAATGGVLTTTAGGWNYTVSGTDADTLSIANKAISASEETIATRATAATSGNATTVTYNVATASEQSSGNYKGTVVFTATAYTAE